MAGFRVVIVGENPQWRESLTMAFRAGSTGEVIAAQSSDEFFNGPRLYPDVVVWKMEDNCPDDLALSLPSFCPLPIVIVDNPNHCNISYLLRAGIKGCLPSRLLPIQIVHTIELTVHAGLLCLPRMSPEAFQDENSPTADYLKQLTPREIQHLQTWLALSRRFAA
jgi:DNA-binding NarL/FixJ family response regulator